MRVALTVRDRRYRDGWWPMGTTEERKEGFH